MTHENPLGELDHQIVRRESIIESVLVARAIDQALGLSLDAANDVEPRLRAAGYEQTKRGDWFLY